MKNQIRNFYLLVLLGLISGCAVVGGIFKAGMWVGIFVTVTILVLFLVAISKIGKKS
jgi:hypothetical protein